MLFRSEKEFSAHFHLGLIRISLLFPFPAAPFLRKEKEDGTLEIYNLSTYPLPKILLLQLTGHWIIQISRITAALPISEIAYQCNKAQIQIQNIILATILLTILCGIHSAIAITDNQSSNSLQNSTTLPTSLPPTLFATTSQTETIQLLAVIGYTTIFLAIFPIAIHFSTKD